MAFEPTPSNHIIIREGYCGGKLHIAGHRIKVQHVAIWHEHMGMTPDDIVADYPTLTLAEVHAALAYYYDHREEIEADIRASDEFVEKMRARGEIPTVTEFLQRLHAKQNPLPPDENINPKIAADLHRRGIDVTTAREAGLLGALDPDQLRYATKEGRVLVTHDSDFLTLHAGRYEHAGVCYCHPKNRSIGEMLRRLVLLWTNATAEDMHGCLTYL